MKKQITAADRKVIEILLQDNYTINQIGVRLGFHKSTIWREIQIRTTNHGYFADIAQIHADERRKKSSSNASKLLLSKTCNYILYGLKSGWSPEQISGCMRLKERDDRICHETIYNFIYQDKYCKKEKTFQYLRRGRKKRRKQTGRSVHKSKIPNRVSITKRPVRNRTINFLHLYL